MHCSCIIPECCYRCGGRCLGMFGMGGSMVHWSSFSKHLGVGFGGGLWLVTMVTSSVMLECALQHGSLMTPIPKLIYW